MARANTIWFYATAIGVLILDQVSKFLARHYLTLDQPVKVIPGFLDLRLAYNTGAAFGVLPNWAPLFIIVALVAVFALVRLRGARNSSLAVAAGLGLLLGGAIGNLIDRLAFPDLGVTDFLDLTVHIKGFAWPTFNVADVAIVLGALLIVFRVYLIERGRTEEEMRGDREQEQRDER